jgi:hypothetical protein
MTDGVDTFEYYVHPIHTVRSFLVWSHISLKVDRMSLKSLRFILQNTCCQRTANSNPSGRPTVLVSTQPLTEMSTRELSWG